MWLSAKNAAAYRKSIKTFKTPNFLDIKKLQTFRQVGSRCQFSSYKYQAKQTIGTHKKGFESIF